MKYDTGVEVAEWWPFFGQWSANSQYGYPLAWHKTKEDAVRAAIVYYTAHPECTAVFVTE